MSGPEGFLEGFGTMVRTARILRGIAQERLGEICSVSRSTIVNVENGKSAPTLPLAMALMLNLEIEWMDVKDLYQHMQFDEELRGMLPMARQVFEEHREKLREESERESVEGRNEDGQ